MRSYLPQHFVPAFTYIMSLKHVDKPDYNLLKLWLAVDEEDEKRVFESQYAVSNIEENKDEEQK